ncbi:MAG: pyrroline-5-carboxylate reductase [Gammaproteobacteria bacterium]|jgi:pyrroline-5-carboxylate reductase|nr:pyrroline-5-carboxylate reductase [Gammaproteobacteria bacterium]
MGKNIGFVGGGNMAQAMIGGLVANKVSAANIMVADPDQTQRELVASRFGVRVMSDNSELASKVDVLVLAVKPQVLAGVARDLAAATQANKPVIVSVVAGIQASSIQTWMGGNVAVVRAMPNSPCLVRQGITALHANALTSNEQRGLAQQILEAVGTVIWLEREELMDAVTAVSGSGPAYFFLFMEAIEQCARRMGLPMEVAWALTLHTGVGAARMALESGQDLAQLRKNVTSPGGTTAAALAIFEQAGLRDIVDRALNGARERGSEIALEFGRE